MNFFRLNPRQDFASYWIDESGEEVIDARILARHRKVAAGLREYLGDPPRKPGKLGDSHITASSYFVRPKALALIESAARGKLISKPVNIEGRGGEEFRQVWVTNFVDCLDIANSSISEKNHSDPGRVGVIKRPVFDEARWDGSDLFVVPQDPSYCYFCTENFVAQWKAAKLKGMMFSRFLMDPDAIRC